MVAGSCEGGEMVGVLVPVLEQLLVQKLVIGKVCWCNAGREGEEKMRKDNVASSIGGRNCLEKV